MEFAKSSIGASGGIMTLWDSSQLDLEVTFYQIIGYLQFFTVGKHALNFPLSIFICQIDIWIKLNVGDPYSPTRKI
jgi:hypothetical protein